MALPTRKPHAEDTLASDRMLAGLLRPQAYPHPVNTPVTLRETHISYVLLAGEFAYKIKKPIHTDFLDYRRLDDRRHFCREELRLNQRYAAELYLEVVPIYADGRLLPADDGSKVIEYAVKMRRFADDALLSERLDAGRLSTTEIQQLAIAVADFHRQAAVDRNLLADSWPDFLQANSRQLFGTIAEAVSGTTAATLNVVQAWSEDYWLRHRESFAARAAKGWIRECHGDLHLQNVVAWQGRMLLFDGIEFSQRLRWIDVLSDAAFLAMDLAARERLDLSRTFMNAYLEQTGDHHCLQTLRWYLCYRSLVRAMVAALRLKQPHLSSSQREAVQQRCRRHVDLAYRYSLREAPTLWITHGVSGSGKTTLSEYVVQRHEAFRLRSDIERKRRFGLSAQQRPAGELQRNMYSDRENQRTYQELGQTAGEILQAGYSVVVDATFLRQDQRQAFWELADQHGAAFAILDCQAPPHTLRQRIADRLAQDRDASDADLQVLEHQWAHQQPLTAAERQKVVALPDTLQAIDQR